MKDPLLAERERETETERERDYESIINILALSFEEFSLLNREK